MKPNQPRRNEYEIWPEIGEALPGQTNDQDVLAIAFERTLEGARRALRERSAGCDDVNAEAESIVSEIFPHDQLKESEKLNGQRPASAKSGTYKRVYGHYIEELFDKSGNQLTVQAVPWELPHGIFERSVPESMPEVRFALRRESPERAEFLENLYSCLEVEILAIKRDRRRSQSSPLVDPIAVERDALLESFKHREQLRLGREVTTEETCAAIPIDPSTFYAWKRNDKNPKKVTLGVNKKIRTFLLNRSLPD